MNGAANACRWRKLPVIESFELAMAYDYNRPFIERKDLAKYLAVDETVARRYGSIILATELSNVEYKIRFGRFHNDHRMKPPPGTGRIFPGYLAVRKLGIPQEYETWIPDHAFDDIYRKHS